MIRTCGSRGARTCTVVVCKTGVRRRLHTGCYLPLDLFPESGLINSEQRCFVLCRFSQCSKFDNHEKTPSGTPLRCLLLSTTALPTCARTSGSVKVIIAKNVLPPFHPRTRGGVIVDSYKRCGANHSRRDIKERAQFQHFRGQTNHRENWPPFHGCEFALRE